MLTLRADRWTRVAATMGLLLLMGAQQKLCPWLTAVPAPEPSVGPQDNAGDPASTGPRARTASSTGSPEPPSGEVPLKRTAPRLPYVLSDAQATTSRTTAATYSAELKLRNGWHDGVVSCGQPRPDRHDTPATEAWTGASWLAFQTRLEAAGVSETVSHRRVIHDPAVGACIARTGPPRA